MAAQWIHFILSSRPFFKIIFRPAQTLAAAREPSQRRKAAVMRVKRDESLKVSQMAQRSTPLCEGTGGIRGHISDPVGVLHKQQGPNDRGYRGLAKDRFHASQAFVTRRGRAVVNVFVFLCRLGHQRGRGFCPR
jgi:hypothetical protein